MNRLWKASLIVTCLLGVAGLTIWTDRASGYSQWSINDDATYCGECHGDFRANDYISPVDGENWGNLHNLHRNTMLSGDCDTCHGAGDEFPVKLNQSAGGEGFEPVSCMGCHGVDPNPGTANTHWGAGLRLHHLNAIVGPDQNGDTCLDCHDDDPVPSGENALPSYYFTPDNNHANKPTDPCNPPPGYPEHYAGLVLGLDNDGDLLYDSADPDCSGIFADGFEAGNASSWSVAVL